MAVSSRELHRIVPTVIIYNEEGKFLLTKRSLTMDTYPGRWDTSGGGLSMDDYQDLPTTNDHQWYSVLEKCLRREVKEELNIEITKPEFLLDVVFMRPDGVPVLVLVYFAKHQSGEIKLSSEHTEFAWVSAEEAKSYDLIGDIAKEIEMVEQRLKS